jgi:hypothetical protein
LEKYFWKNFLDMNMMHELPTILDSPPGLGQIEYPPLIHDDCANRYSIGTTFINNKDMGATVTAVIVALILFGVCAFGEAILMWLEDRH